MGRMLIVRERSESRMTNLAFFKEMQKTGEEQSQEKKKVQLFSFENVKIETSMSNV